MIPPRHTRPEEPKPALAEQLIEATKELMNGVATQAPELIAHAELQPGGDVKYRFEDKMPMSPPRLDDLLNQLTTLAIAYNARGLKLEFSVSVKPKE
jgi:hypothetical protein